MRQRRTVVVDTGVTPPSKPAKSTGKLRRRKKKKEDGERYLTIAAYVKYAGLTVPPRELGNMGKLAAQFCREKRHAVRKVPDDRWGVVNSYPVAVLRTLFGGNSTELAENMF